MQVNMHLNSVNVRAICDITSYGKFLWPGFFTVSIVDSLKVLSRESMTHDVFRGSLNFCESQNPYLCLKTQQLLWAFIISRSVNIIITERCKRNNS